MVYLVEVAVVAAFELLVHRLIDRISSLVPEPRKVACFVVFIARSEIMVSTGTFPQYLGFCWFEWLRLIEITLKTDKIAHASGFVSIRTEGNCVIDLRSDRII
jgi:hypothetical protein